VFAKLFVFELLEDSPHEEDLLADADAANCEALEDAELVAKLSVRDLEASLLVAKLSVVAVFAARLWLEEAVRLAFNVAALLLEPVSVDEAFFVSLADNAPMDAVALLFARPVVFEVLPPLEELLLLVELPTELAVPFAPAAARLAVEL
jgi:hypothetical protein